MSPYCRQRRQLEDNGMILILIMTGEQFVNLQIHID